MNFKRSTILLLLATLMTVLSFSAASPAQIGLGISVRIGPPALPVYTQPLCPGPGYVWTPGYWSWEDEDGYYWVPGTWVVAPVGLLWTPGYWGWNDGAYAWNTGYWGPHIGFYGGINYGFGYSGDGFYGGEWRGDHFYYNRSVTNVNVTNVTTVYNKTVVVNNNTHVSFNGGNGGVRARPTQAQEVAAREPHREAISEQVQHEHSARTNPELRASVNHGRPAIAATARPADFNQGVIRAKAAGAPYRAPKTAPKEAVVRGGASGNLPAANNDRAAKPANRKTPAARENNNRPAARTNAPVRTDENRTPSASRPANSRTENAPKTNNRPPSASRPESAPKPNRPAREATPAARENRPPQHQAAPAPRESHPPQYQAAPAPQRHESAPAQQRQSAPPKHHESAPAPHQSAPPARKESAPPKQHQGPGR